MLTRPLLLVFFFNDTATTEIYTLSLHDALPIYLGGVAEAGRGDRACLRAHPGGCASGDRGRQQAGARSEEHTSELQSRLHLVCRLLLEKKKQLRERIWSSLQHASRHQRHLVH